jgi:inorganic pyrophosphatase
MIEIKTFFEDYKALENKSVIIEKLLDRADALKTIQQAAEYYQQNKAKLLQR